MRRSARDGRAMSLARYETREISGILREQIPVLFALHTHRIAPNQDNSKLSPIREGAHVGIMVCLQIWLIANALILAWALWPVAPEKPLVEPSLKDPARGQAKESVSAAVNFM